MHLLLSGFGAFQQILMVDKEFVALFEGCTGILL